MVRGLIITDLSRVEGKVETEYYVFLISDCHELKVINGPPRPSPFERGGAINF